jgi:hypothetical protein
MYAYQMATVINCDVSDSISMVWYGMVLTVCYNNTFLYPLRVLKLLYTHSVVTLSLLHAVGSMFLQDSRARSNKKFPLLMGSKSMKELTTNLFLFSLHL